jgi:hypothetical protein
MKMIIEYACERCGAQLMKAPPELGGAIARKAGSSCSECGHSTDPANMARFQWPPSLKTMVDRLCNPVERKQLRLNPTEFVANQLHSKLRALGKPAVEIDASSTPLTIRFKVHH